MKGKQLALILVLLLAIGGGALFLRKHDTASWSDNAVGAKDKILQFPLNDVAEVAIKSGDAELHLVKKDETWRVGERADFPADFQRVASLVRKLGELHAAQEMQVGSSQLGRLHLTEPGSDPNSGTLLDLKGSGGRELATLLLGKKQMQESANGGRGFPVGRYVTLPAQTDRVFLVSDTFEEAQAKPGPWLNHDFVRIENPRSIALTGTSPEMNWTVTRESATAPWTLAASKPGEVLDENVITTAVNYLATLNFTDVLAPDAAPTTTGLDQPATLKVETFDGFTYEMRIGKLMDENYPVLVSVRANLPNERTPAPDEKPENKTVLDQQFQARQKQLREKLAKEEKLPARTYLIVRSTVEQFLKVRGALLQPTPSPSPAAPVTKPSASAPPKARAK